MRLCGHVQLTAEACGSWNLWKCLIFHFQAGCDYICIPKPYKSAFVCISKVAQNLKSRLFSKTSGNEANWHQMACSWGLFLFVSAHLGKEWLFSWNFSCACSLPWKRPIVFNNSQCRDHHLTPVAHFTYSLVGFFEQSCCLLLVLPLATTCCLLEHPSEHELSLKGKDTVQFPRIDKHVKCDPQLDQIRHLGRSKHATGVNY